MSEPLRILELRSVRGTGGGPEKTILAGAMLTDRTRYAVTVCYIRDERDDVFAIDQRASTMGLDYVEIRERHSFDFAIWPALRALVRSRGIDIVHSHDHKTNFYAWLLGRFERVVPLATLHGYTGDSSRESIYYWFDKRIVQRFPLVIAVSDDLRHELVRRGARPDRIVRVLNGIDDRQFRRDRAQEVVVRESLHLTADDVVIGAVGRLERQKRFDLLLEAFARLIARMPHERLRLVIVGDGSLRAALENQCQQLGLNDRVILTGHRTDIDRLHHAFDIFVQSSDYEGTPNAVLEAMALQTPLIATDVGGTAELATSGIHGLIVPPGQPDAIVAAVEQFLAQPEQAAALAAAARTRVETDLSFRARMASVEQLYDRLASETKARR